MLLSQHRMDGHIFRYSQAVSIGICACTLHALRNLLQHYTRVSSFLGVWQERKTIRTLKVLELKIFQNPGTGRMVGGAVYEISENAASRRGPSGACRQSFHRSSSGQPRTQAAGLAWAARAAQPGSLRVSRQAAQPDKTPCATPSDRAPG